MKTREYEFDNAKGFLIFCVVLGHMLEGNLTGVSKTLYILIYSFHMPFFVFTFLSGLDLTIPLDTIWGCHGLWYFFRTFFWDII